MVKKVLSEGQNRPTNLISQFILYKPFELKIELKVGLSRIQNRAQVVTEQLWSNSQKVQKTGFMSLIKTILSERQNLNLNFDFRGLISTYQAENIE